MVGRLTLDQVVKVRVLAPQLRETPAGRGVSLFLSPNRVARFANRLQTYDSRPAVVLELRREQRERKRVGEANRAEFARSD
jgi:hypothetical protein